MAFARRWNSRFWKSTSASASASFASASARRSCDRRPRSGHEQVALLDRAPSPWPRRRRRAPRARCRRSPAPPAWRRPAPRRARGSPRWRPRSGGSRPAESPARSGSLAWNDCQPTNRQRARPSPGNDHAPDPHRDRHPWFRPPPVRQGSGRRGSRRRGRRSAGPSGRGSRSGGPGPRSGRGRWKRSRTCSPDDVVEVPGRLVGEDDRRPPGQGPGDRDPLLLTAREVARAERLAVREADRLEPARRLAPGRAGRECP